MPLHFQIFIGMVAGVLFGVLLPGQVSWVAWLGDIFIKLLRMIVMPFIFISIVDGIVRVGSMKRLGELGGKTAVFYLATNWLAVLTSLVLVNLIRPGVGVKIFGEKVASSGSPGDILDFIPANIFQAFFYGNTLQLIFVAIFFGAGLVAVREKVPTLIAGLSEANEFFLKLTSFLIRLAPLGVFGLLAVMTKNMDWTTFLGIGKFAAVILIGLIIHGGVTLPVFFKIFSDRPFFPFVRMMQPALLSAFSTSSSAATLPLTLECVEREAKVPPEIAGFVLPVGATVNMDGTAIYEAAACLFVAQSLGIDLNLGEQLIVFFTASLAAIGAAAIPSAGLVTLAMVLTAVHLPLEGIGFLLAIDRPLDMSRTVVNVWGDMVACAVVEGKKKK